MPPLLRQPLAPMGIFLTLAEPTEPMIAEAASAGLYDTGYGKFPRLQIVTIAGLFAGVRPVVPLGHAEGFKKAAKEKPEAQAKLL